MNDATGRRESAYTEVAERLRMQEDVFHIEGIALDLFLKRDFLSAEECASLIEFIDGNRHRSTVLGTDPDRDFREVQEFRTSDSCAVESRRGDLVGTISTRIAELTGIDQKFGESMEGLRYAEGQQFKPHHDYFHTSAPYWPKQERAGGQRTWTVMIALKQPDAGGGTLFPAAGVRLKPRAGSLLAWCNLGADGEPNPNSLHSGEPVLTGVKYVLTKWHRERPFVPQEARAVTMAPSVPFAAAIAASAAAERLKLSTPSQAGLVDVTAEAVQ